jgi:hypothetical protein
VFPGRTTGRQDVGSAPAGSGRTGGGRCSCCGGTALVYGYLAVLTLRAAATGGRMRSDEQAGTRPSPPSSTSPRSTGGVRRVVRWSCQVAFVPKGVAFRPGGRVLGRAGITLDPVRRPGWTARCGQSRWPATGPELLTAIAVGIGLFSVCCFARARHPVS